MNKRGAYFFVMDALIAGAVLIATVLYIFSMYSIAPEQDTTFRVADDFLKYISETKVREVNSANMNQLIADGNITDLDNTLAQQMLEFYYAQKGPQIRNMTRDLATHIVPKEKGIMVFINGSNKYYNSGAHLPNDTYATSNLAVSRKIMVFKRINETIIFGPIWIEVKVWA